MSTACFKWAVAFPHLHPLGEFMKGGLAEMTDYEIISIVIAIITLIMASVTLLLKLFVYLDSKFKSK